MRVLPLVILGFPTVIITLVLIMIKKASLLVALIVVSMATGTISCFLIAVAPEGTVEGMQGVVDLVANFKSLSDMITGSESTGSMAVTGVMFASFILFFGILTDADIFRPIVKGVLSLVGTNPVKIGIGTAILAATAYLDGSGAVTSLICVPALLLLHGALGTCCTMLATIVALSTGTMNILPWGGPTIHVATALDMSDNLVAFFLPVLPAVLVDLVCALVIPAFLGAGEKKRIGTVVPQATGNTERKPTEEQKALLRPHLLWVNTTLIVAAVVSLLFFGFAPAVVSMVFYVLATVTNYPSVKDSKARVDIHAKEALMMCSVLFAVGCFTGIMQGTGMIAEMANMLVFITPHMMGKFLPFIIGIIGMSVFLSFDPGSSHYGVLPVLIQTAEGFDVVGVDIGRAAILDQMTIGLPASPLTASTFLLVGLSGVDFGEHQKKTVPLIWLVSLVMVVAAILARGTVI